MNSFIDQLRKNLGYWLISSDRYGGYAYAKICSNGKVYFIHYLEDTNAVGKSCLS